MNPRKPVAAMTLDLPMPISTNDLWMPVRRGQTAAMIRTSQYKNWLVEAGLFLNRQAKNRIIGPYALSLYVSRKSRADLGNAEKAVSDLLQTHGVIENDRHAQRIEMAWADVPGMRVQLFASKPKHGAAA